MKQLKLSVALFFILLPLSKSIWAHGFLNTRFYPSALTIDDPFITDKLFLTTYHTESPAENGGDKWTTNPKLTYGKTITKDLVASISGNYLHIKNPGQRVQNGFDDWTIGARYNALQIPDAETMLSVALNATIGGTGSHIVDAESSTTLAPEILLGQGLLNVPDNIKYVKPIAIFISVSPEIITNNYTVTSVNAGAAIQYSLPVLQQVVGNLNSPLMDHLVPTVEFPFTICTQGTCSGQTTGTINPGLIAYNKYGQIGLEASIPANSNTGSKIGGVFQLYLYLDGIFPNSIGKPLLSS